MRNIIKRGLKSYVSGTHSVVLNGLTIPEQQRVTTEKFPDNLAVSGIWKQPKNIYDFVCEKNFESFSEFCCANWAYVSIYPEIIKQKQFTFADMERDTNNVAANLISLGLFSQ